MAVLTGGIIALIATIAFIGGTPFIYHLKRDARWRKLKDTTGERWYAPRD